MEGKIIVCTTAQVEAFVELLVRSKAVWMDPELLNLVGRASTPSAARRSVFKQTGSRNKAKAAQLLAVAIRDYYPLWPQSCIRMLKYGCNLRPELLKQHLKSTLTLDESDEHN